METQRNEISLTSASEYANVPFTPTKMLGMASLVAPTLSESHESRTPVDIVCVIDRSGSMSGSKLNMTKETLKFLVSQLDSRDQIALVMFDTTVETIFPFTSTSSSAKERINEVIDKLKVGASTNLSGGLMQGISLTPTRTRKNRVCSVLLFTDGQANAGVQDPTQLKELTAKAIGNLEDACTIFTFGFGSDHDADLLRGLAQVGKGMYYYLESTESIPSSFADCLGGLQSVVAQNVHLTVNATDGAKVLRSLSRFPLVSPVSFPATSFTLDLGDLYSEENRDLIVEFELPACDPAERFSYVQYSLSYFNIQEAAARTVASESFVRRQTATKDASERRDERIDMHAMRIQAADSMEQATKLVQQNDTDAARAVIRETLDQFRTATSSSSAMGKQIIAEMEMLSLESDYQRATSYMASRSMQHQQQRAADESSDFDMYSNNAKKRSKFSALSRSKKP